MKGQRPEKSWNNQKKTDIKRREAKAVAETKNYTTLGYDAMEEASKILSAKGFRIWIYLMKNKPGYEGWEISSKDALNNWGIKQKEFLDGVNELIDCGFLNLKEGAEYPNTWIFNEFTQDEELRQS